MEINSGHFGTVKWYGFGIVSLYVVTLSIFPGYITEDVHSQLLKDWYPILLITGYNVFDLVGKSLTPVLFFLMMPRLLLVPASQGCCFASILRLLTWA